MAYGVEGLMRAYDAPVVASNITRDGKPLFAPWFIRDVGGVRVGLLGYDDPAVPRRQPPSFSRGLSFEKPHETLRALVRHLREIEGAELVLLQRVALADSPIAAGVDFVLGGDTHERVRLPLDRRFAAVTEPGAFGSFVGRLDLWLEGSRIVERQ